MKKIVTLLLVAVLTVGLFASCAPSEKTHINVGALKGPTGMGMSKLMVDAKDGKTANDYEFEVFAAPTEVTGLLLNGELDIAAVPTNLAATLYNKSGGKIKIVALNTLSVLYVLEKGNTIESFTDLEGKKIYASGKGATPEYALNYLLKENNITCEVEYFANHEEVVTQALAGNADIIVIPEPNVSNLKSKSPEYRIAIDINDVWAQTSQGQSLISMGCIVAQTEFIENNKKALNEFLKEYADSVKYVNEDIDNAAGIIAELGIVPSRAIAQNAIPNSSIVCITGEEMKTKATPFIKILFDSNPQSVGGKLPGEDFWYIK